MNANDGLGLPDHDPGEFPVGYSDPVENSALPWVSAYDPDQPDPVPTDRLAEESAWEFEGAEENGQNDRLAPPDLLAAFSDQDQPPSEGGPSHRVSSGVSGIDLRDYSRNPQGKGWGSPCSGTRARVQVGAAAVSVDVRVAELVGTIMRNAEGLGYRHRAADTGAYNCRKIAGTNSWSNHAWALAIDINWQSNPYTSPLRTDIPEWYRHLFNRYGFAWGGDYYGRKDAMHFEFMGTPAQAVAATNLARAELSGGGGSWQPIVNAPLGQRILRKWMRGSDVAFVQRWHGIAADGYFGNDTVAAVRRTQERNRVTVDGIVGPVTWRLMGIRV